MNRGRCVICDVVGQGEKDFICERCGHPEKITVYCIRCREPKEASAEILEVVERFSKGAIPKRPGIILKISSCLACARPGEATETSIYALSGGVLN